MKKRLRKKKRVGEFRDFGFKLGFRFDCDIEIRNDLLERFIRDAIEANSFQFGGGGPENEWVGIVCTDTTHSQVDENGRHKIEQWFIEEPLVLSYFVTSWYDIGACFKKTIEWHIKNL